MGVWGRVLKGLYKFYASERGEAYKRVGGLISWGRIRGGAS